MSPRHTRFALLGGFLSLLAVLTVVMSTAGRQAPPPSDEAAAPSLAASDRSTPSAPRLTSIRSSEPEEVPTTNARQTVPNPTPIPPADPAAEFRVDPFAGRVIDGTTFDGISDTRVSELLFQAGRYYIAPGYPSLIDEVTSAADGRFKFQEQEVVRGEVLGWLAEADGYARQILLFPAGEGLGDRLRSTFQLMPGDSISGVVVDEGDQPIAGALVGDIVMGASSRAGSAAEFRLPSAHVYTGGDGRFLLDGIEAGKSLRIPVRAEGYMMLESDPVAAGATDVVLRLVRAEAGLRGIVRDWEGRPVEGARLELTDVETRLSGARPLRRLTTTDSTGRFAIEGLVAGRFTLHTVLDVPETLGPGCSDTRHLSLLPGALQEVEIHLPAPARLSGRFIDATSGEGVAGIIVYTNIDDVTLRERAFSIEADREGNFAFTAFVPADSPTHEVRLPVNWGEGWFPVPREEQDELIRTEQDYLSFMAVQPGEERHDIAVLLAPGGVLTGVVYQPEGDTPAADVPVYIRGERHFDSVVTNESGEFRAGVPNGIRLRIESSSDEGIGMMSIQTQLQMPPAVLRLGKYGILEGVVEEEDGTPVADLVVSTRRPGGEDSFMDAVRFEERTLTNPDGTWRIEYVAHGALSLQVEVSHAHGYAPVRPMDIHLEPGGHLTGLRLLLERGDYIDGIVLDDGDGKPLEGVTLFTSLREISTATDENGRFRLEGVPYESALQYVTASIEGYGEETRRNVSIYDGDVVFRLKRLAGTTLRVVNESGSPVPSFRAQLIGSRPDMPGRGSQALREILGTDPSGVVSLGNLAPGDYRVEVVELLASGGEGQPGGEDFVVPSTGTGAPMDVVVRLSAGRMIEGTVMRGMMPAGNALVELLNPPMTFPGASGPPGARIHRSPVDGAGRFSIGPLPRGSYEIRAVTEGASSSTELVRIDTANEYIELLLQPVPRVYGTISARNGEPLRRGSVFIMPEDGPPIGPPLSIRGGSYQVDLPAEGTWQLAFSDDDSPDVITRMVTLQQGQTREINIAFGNRVTLHGRIYVNGVGGRDAVPVLLRSHEGEDALAAPRGNDGTFEVELSPGTYDLFYTTGQVTAPFGMSIMVDAALPRQERDLHVNMAALDVLTVTPEDGPVSGELTIESVANGRPVTVLRRFPIDRRSMRFLQLPAGSYRGELHSRSGGVAESGWIDVHPGEPAIMTIMMP